MSTATHPAAEPIGPIPREEGRYHLYATALIVVRITPSTTQTVPAN